MRACSRTVRDNIDIHLARHLVLEPHPGSPLELRVSSGSGLLHPAFAFWKSTVDYDDLDDNVSDNEDDPAGDAAETRRVQAAKRHCLAIARFTEVVDICEGPPFGSVVPLGQGLKNVQMVRLLRNPGQYAYPQIRAPTRVVFTGWQRISKGLSDRILSVGTMLPHHKRYVANVAMHRKGPWESLYIVGGWTLAAKNPEIEEAVVRLSVRSVDDDPDCIADGPDAQEVMRTQPEPVPVRTNPNFNSILAGEYPLPQGALLTVVGAAAFESFHGPPYDPDVVAPFQASPGQPPTTEDHMRTMLNGAKTPARRLRFMTENEFRDGFDEADRYALETDERATVGYRPIMKTWEPIEEQ